ncbi:MAG: DUF4476 domain-containing protein [Persicimonas sp.]
MRYAILLSFLAATFLSIASGYAGDRHSESCSDCKTKETVRHVNRAGGEVSVEVTYETIYEGSSSNRGQTTRRDRSRTDRRTDRARRSRRTRGDRVAHRGNRSRGHSHRSRRGHHGHTHDHRCDHGDDYYDDDDYDDDDESYGDDDDDYVEAMSDADFYALLESIKAESFSSGRMRVVEHAVKYHYFSSAQVRQIVEVMTFGSNRVEVAVLLYPEVVDPANFYQVFSAFTFESNKREVQERLEI